MAPPEKCLNEIAARRLRKAAADRERRARMSPAERERLAAAKRARYAETMTAEHRARRTAAARERYLALAASDEYRARRNLAQRERYAARATVQNREIRAAGGRDLRKRRPRPLLGIREDAHEDCERIRPAAVAEVQFSQQLSVPCTNTLVMATGDIAAYRKRIVCRCSSSAATVRRATMSRAITCSIRQFVRSVSAWKNTSTWMLHKETQTRPAMATRKTQTL
ncbi:uncharacterized protein [Dermacentor andersoni]|uniref:uncharacterized protein n=1 Tax=Dermacentor andersoni TaxID=34620 RepID=UPI003B3B6B43